MSVLHWLSCDVCGTIYEDVLVDLGNMPECDHCNHPLRITWEHGKPPATDMWSTPRYSEAAGRSFSSQRQKSRYMKNPRNNEWGISYTEAGDKVHGARPDLSIQNKGFSYKGQKSRKSTAERSNGSR